MKDKISDFYLLVARIWLSYSMIMGGQSILRFFSSQELRDFFEHWFGEELGFPAPLFMAFIAKGTEFVGGILVGLGLFTRISAAFLAVVMATATLVANIDYQGVDGYIRQDGIVTISCCLFSCLLIQTGSGKFGLDQVYLTRRNKLK